MIDEHIIQLGIAYCDGALLGYAFRMNELNETLACANAALAADVEAMQQYSLSPLGQLACCLSWGCMAARLNEHQCATACPVDAPYRIRCQGDKTRALQMRLLLLAESRDDARAAKDVLVYHAAFGPAYPLNYDIPTRRVLEVVVSWQNA